MLLFKRKDNLFKEINKQNKAEFREIKKIAGPETRLARYETLKGKFGGLYGEGQVRNSVGDINLGDGVILNTVLPAGITAIAGGITLVLCFPPALPAVAALSASVGLVGRHLTYRSEAKNVGLRTRDVKYAVKTQRLEEKVRKTAKSLSLEIKTKKDLEKLRGKFKPAAEGAVTAEPAASPAPAATHKPAQLKS